MGGGLLQIAAYGAQDVYLTGDPQITFFKVVYRRHTNFSMESIQQQFSGKVGFGKSDLSCTISRNGDLVNSMILQVTLPQLPTGCRWIDHVGHRLIRSVRINLGGDTIDEHNGRWFEIWNQLTHDDSMKKAYDEMVGYHGLPGWNSTGQVDGAQTLYIPLQFWFNRNPGLSLPLIALQYHEVKVIFNFEDVGKLVIWPYASGNADWQANALLSLENDGPYNGVAASTGNLTNTSHGVLSANWKTALVTAGSEFTANLYVDYIYLDTEERKRFAQMSHEYLIDQLQIHGKETLTSYSHRMRLNFNHPVKELIWVFEPPEGDYITLSDDTGTGLNFTSAANLRTGFNTGADVNLNEQVKYRWGNFGEITKDDESDIYEWMKDAKLQINGHDRFSTRPGSYFRRVQPYQFHGGVPDVPIYVYSFALRPEEFQPSGTCNFSRIDNAYLELNLNKFVKPAVYSNTIVGSTTTTTNYTNAPRVPYYSIEAEYNNNSSTATTIGPGHANMNEQKAPWSTVAGKLVQPTWRANSKLNLYAYAVSYNVLKIVSGRGGLAYSN